MKKCVLMAIVAFFSMGVQALDLVEKEMPIGFNDVFVPGGFDSNSDSYVVLSGMFPNGCYKWSGADVSHEADNVHVISGAARVSQGMCPMVIIPFTKEVRLGKLGVGTHSIRVQNGDGTYLEKRLVIEE